MELKLNCKWSLYLHYKDLGRFYNDNIEKLMDISDIETFWRTFNNIPKIYDIFSDGISTKKIKRVNATPSAYSFFRDDIFPCWEDPENTNGFEFSIKNGNDLKKLQEEWMDCILELIGNSDDIVRHINGIRMVDCTKYSSVLYRMEIWVDNEKYKPEIEKIIKKQFKLGGYKLLYRSHKNIKETV
tara:strand:+ start:17338 stop:17892 length:555 start_codon:yes stop_codon:yes gene_type:complete